MKRNASKFSRLPFASWVACVAVACLQIISGARTMPAGSFLLWQKSLRGKGAAKNLLHRAAALPAHAEALPLNQDLKD